MTQQNAVVPSLWLYWKMTCVFAQVGTPRDRPMTTAWGRLVAPISRPFLLRWSRATLSEFSASPWNRVEKPTTSISYHPYPGFPIMVMKNIKSGYLIYVPKLVRKPISIQVCAENSGFHPHPSTTGSGARPAGVKCLTGDQVGAMEKPWRNSNLEPSEKLMVKPSEKPSPSHPSHHHKPKVPLGLKPCPFPWVVYDCFTEI